MVGGVRWHILDLNLGIGGLLERLDEQVGLANDGAHSRHVTKETEGHVSRVGFGTVHVTIRVVRVGGWLAIKVEHSAFYFLLSTSALEEVVVSFSHNVVASEEI